MFREESSAGPTQESEAVNLNGRDFSFDPTRLDLRAESGGAQHGLTFDDWGHRFVCSNSDHIQMVMFEDRYVARNPFFAGPIGTEKHRDRWRGGGGVSHQPGRSLAYRPNPHANR